MELSSGLQGRAEAEVTAADTAVALGSGEVAVLGTPRVLALAEAATVAALAGRLEPGRTTVGSRIALEHTAPTPVGARVAATAELCRVQGRRLLFEVAVVQEHRTVAHGTVERVLVDRERFEAGA